MECKGCSKGISMCYNRPCMGSPEDFEKIIDAGFANKLRIDHWNGHHDSGITSIDDIDTKEDPMLEILLGLGKLLKGDTVQKPNPHKENVEFLAGGTPTDVNYYAPFWPTGRCNLLTEDNLCSLHDLGLKPTQGKAACCKVSDVDDEKVNSNLHYVNMWATDKGLAVIEKFKKTVGI